MDKFRRSGYSRIPCICGAVTVLSAHLAVASTVTVPVRVTFVNPIAISKVSALQFGSIDQNLVGSETVTVAPDSTVIDLAGRVEGGPQAAASLTITASPGHIITIFVDSVVSGAGYSLTDFRCKYNAGSDGACDGVGYSATSVASSKLLVGATLTGDGTAEAGVVDGSLYITIIYQ